MDYLEGFLIGPVWSDTDYRSRRHFSAHVMLAAIMASAFVALTVFPELATRYLILKWPLPPIFLVALLLLNPFISLLYRRLPFILRPLLLVVYAFKYLLLFLWLVHIFLPVVSFEKESFLNLLYARMDNHVEVALEKIAVSGGIFATVAGVVVGGLWVITEVFLVVAFLIAVPLVAILLCKGIQYLIDRTVKYILDRELARVASYSSAEIVGATSYEEMTAEKEVEPERKRGTQKLKAAVVNVKQSLTSAASVTASLINKVFKQLTSAGQKIKDKIKKAVKRQRDRREENRQKDQEKTKLPITRVTVKREDDGEGDTIIDKVKSVLHRRESNE